MIIATTVGRFDARPDGSIALRRAGWPALGGLLVLALGPVDAAATAPPSETSDVSCVGRLERAALGPQTQVQAVGRTRAEVPLEAPAGRELLIEADERGNDVVLEVAVPSGLVLARADNPVRRAGRQWAIVPAGHPRALAVRVAGKEHADVSGQVTIRAFDLDALGASDRCVQAVHALAAADANYALGQSVSLARSSAGKTAARHAYLLAVEQYRLAYQLLDLRTDALLRLAAAHAIAATYYQELQDWTRAAEWATQTALLAGQQHRVYDQARANALLAAAWMESATLSSSTERTTRASAPGRVLMARARALLNDLERLHRRRGELYDAALVFNNVGVSYFYEARFSAAAFIFQDAIDRFAALREWPRRGVALQNVALCEWGRGDLVAAVRTFRAALEQLGPAPYPRLYLTTLINSALANFAIGDFDTALRLSSRALTFARTVQARVAEGRSLYALGVTYYALGDRPLARQYLEESLPLLAADVDARARVTTLRALSTLYGDEGRPEAAIAVDEVALALSANTPSRARMLVRRAEDQTTLGRYDEALATLGVILAEDRGDDAGVRAQAMIARGRIQRLTGRLAEALIDLNTALPLVRRLDLLEAQFHAELELARTLRQLHRPQQALAAVDRALARSEELRRQTANPELRAQRQTSLRPAYELKITLLADRYRESTAAGRTAAAQRLVVEALATAERQRAQTMADIASLKFASTAGGVLGPQLLRRESLYREIAARRYRLADREDSGAAVDAAAAALRAEIAGLRRELDELNAALARQAGIRRSGELQRPQSWPGLLRRLAPDVVIVDYWLGAEEAYAWTITADGIGWHMLGDSGPVADAARALHGSLRQYASQPLSERVASAARLYDLILRPIKETLADRREMIVIADGALTYVPFAALTAESAQARGYLVEQHDLAVAPAAWWLFSHASSPQAAAATPGRMLLVSDPIYSADDERVPSTAVDRRVPAAVESEAVEPATGRIAALRRLPWTARESAAIASLVSGPLLDQLSGASATRSQLLSKDWSRYRIIHLASHALVDASMPQLSALILSAYDERGQRVEQALRAADLDAVSLNADLLVLSACDTALGKEVVGEGSVGLAYTAMARGARVVVASLWQVPDEMSARVMTGFYRAVLRERRGAASALAGAMRTVLAENPQADPALWAAFQVSVSQLDGWNGSKLGNARSVNQGSVDEARETQEESWRQEGQVSSKEESREAASAPVDGRRWSAGRPAAMIGRGL